MSTLSRGQDTGYDVIINKLISTSEFYPHLVHPTYSFV